MSDDKRVEKLTPDKLKEYLSLVNPPMPMSLSLADQRRLINDLIQRTRERDCANNRLQDCVDLLGIGDGTGPSGLPEYNPDDGILPGIRDLQAKLTEAHAQVAAVFEHLQASREMYAFEAKRLTEAQERERVLKQVLSSDGRFRPEYTILDWVADRLSGEGLHHDQRATITMLRSKGDSIRAALSAGAAKAPAAQWSQDVPRLPDGEGAWFLRRPNSAIPPVFEYWASEELDEYRVGTVGEDTGWWMPAPPLPEVPAPPAPKEDQP